MVPVHDQRVAVQGRRAAFTVSVLRLHLTQVGLPPHGTFQVQREEPAGAKEREQQLAVGHGRTGRIASGLVSSLVRELGEQRPLPRDAAVVPIDRERHEAVAMGHRHAVVSTRSAVVPRFRDRPTVGHGGGEVHAIARDDRRRVPPARRSDLPAQVPGLAPAQRRSGLRRGARAQRTAPLRPGLGVAPRRCRQRKKREEEYKEHPVSTRKAQRAPPAWSAEHRGSLTRPTGPGRRDRFRAPTRSPAGARRDAGKTIRPTGQLSVWKVPPRMKILGTRPTGRTRPRTAATET